MVWTWRFEQQDGTQVAQPDGLEEFPGQGDAESWIGETWKQLLADGVDRAVLIEDGREIYTMSLHEA